MRLKSPMIFIKASEKPKVKSNYARSFSFVSVAKDSVILMDIGNKDYVFPPELFVTSLCPDILACSLSSKQVVAYWSS